MYSKRRIFFVIGILVFALRLIAFPMPSQASETEHMLQTWPAVVFEGESEKLIGFGEMEARTGFGVKPGEGIQFYLLRGGSAIDYPRGCLF